MTEQIKIDVDKFSKLPYSLQVEGFFKLLTIKHGEASDSPFSEGFEAFYKSYHNLIRSGKEKGTQRIKNNHLLTCFIDEVVSNYNGDDFLSLKEDNNFMWIFKSLVSNCDLNHETLLEFKDVFHNHKELFKLIVSELVYLPNSQNNGFHYGFHLLLNKFTVAEEQKELFKFLFEELDYSIFNFLSSTLFDIEHFSGLYKNKETLYKTVFSEVLSNETYFLPFYVNELYKCKKDDGGFDLTCSEFLTTILRTNYPLVLDSIYTAIHKLVALKSEKPLTFFETHSVNQNATLESLFNLIYDINNAKYVFGLDYINREVDKNLPPFDVKMITQTVCEDFLILCDSYLFNVVNHNNTNQPFNLKNLANSISLELVVYKCYLNHLDCAYNNYFDNKALSLKEDKNNSSTSKEKKKEDYEKEIEANLAKSFKNLLNTYFNFFLVNPKGATHLSFILSDVPKRKDVLSIFENAFKNFLNTQHNENFSDNENTFAKHLLESAVYSSLKIEITPITQAMVDEVLQLNLVN